MITNHWDEKTLYQRNPLFGIGMSGWQEREWWHHKEDVDNDWFSKHGPVAANLYLLEIIELWW